MDSSSRDTLSRLFYQIILWMRREYIVLDEFKFRWNELHLSVVHDHALRFGLHSDFKVQSYAKLFDDPLWFRYATPGSYKKYAEIVASFTQELQEFFRVPRLHQLFEKDNTLKENELLAAFINFLLRLLYHKTDSTDLFKEGCDCLQKELRFLLTVLGDIILLSDEQEEVQNLLAEFEEVANEAGSLVHSFFFSMDPLLKIMDEGFDVVLKHIKLLTDNVMKFLNLPPFIGRAYVAPKTSARDSLLIVDSLLYDLVDLMNREDNMIADVKDQFKILHQGLIFCLFFIQDIGAPRPSEIEELKEPLMQIGDVACEAEYLVNSFLVGDVPLLYLIIRLTDVIDRIELIGAGLQKIKKYYGVGALKVAKGFTAQLSLQAKINSEVDDITVGLEDKATDILDPLIGGTGHLQIISIFGMPGLGKTTLANKLYNHPSVKYKFDKCLWCVVSQTYDRKNLLIDILISSKSELHKVEMLNMEEESLVVQIYKSLKRRRYLIVMDDIWSSNTWYDLQRCFPDDGNGSRILLTSRNKDVAPPNCIMYELPSLSDEQCWELLEKKVFQNEPCPPQLRETGKKIAANCCGVPLAVVAIAGILSSMEKEGSTWENVEGNLASYIYYSDQNNSMMQILELSYEHLSDHLKSCFLYFGAFPGEKEIPVRKLMRLWIAEGFIRKEGRKSSESVAEEYLTELIDRSLVMVSKRRSDGGVKACVVHDLLRDLCLKISERENFLKLSEYSIYEKGHRILLLGHSISPFGQHVRSFHGYPPESPFYVLNMKLLKSLEFQSIIKDADPPHLIGTEFLVQLRYLVITDLPAPICSLVNLEFLVVNTSKRIVIPPVMVKMMKLRYVDFIAPALPAIFDEDCNSSQTNNLEFLSNVTIRNLKDEEMLKCSPHLRKLKCQCEALWAAEKGAYRYPDFGFFTQLESINMTTNYALEMAQVSLPMSIKKLTLSDLRLPWENMSIIGLLPNLQVLKLSYDAFVGEIWDTRDGEFQQLTFLKLDKIDYLVQWNVASSQHFPKLQLLILRACENLQEIPREIGEVGMLQSIELERCPKALEESAIKIRQEQQDMGNEELRVIINK